MLDIPLCAITPSKVIQILNMATPEDLIDDEYYEILCEDVMQVCFLFLIFKNVYLLILNSLWNIFSFIFYQLIVTRIKF
jgi:hypothetical protein